MTVKGNHPLAEIIARKLIGIESVPSAEQRKMVNRAVKAAVEYHEAELESKRKIISVWDYIFGDYGPTAIAEKIKTLQADIERKDEVLRYIQSLSGDEMIGETDILERIENCNIPEFQDSSILSTKDNK